MLIPIGFLKTFYRFPWANIVLIALCVLLHLPSMVQDEEDLGWQHRLVLYPATIPEEVQYLAPEEFVQHWKAHVWTRQPWTLVTYAFVHGDFMHLLGNMLFLFVFGCAVNSELGHGRYILVYVTAAVLSAAGYLILGDGPMVGASGAICGITGIVAALYPRNDVRLAYFFGFWFMGTTEWSALFFVGLWFSLDVVNQLLGQSSGIAYMAHIAGYLFGFAFGVLTLKAGWVVSDGNDFLSWFLGMKVARIKRRQFAGAIRMNRPVAELSRPKPSPDWEPIPLAEDPSPVAHKPRDKDAPTFSVPVYKRISEYFESVEDVKEIPEADAAELEGWYEQYRQRHAGARISPKGLTGMARLLYRRGSKELALDAYERAVKASPPGRSAIVALEGAKVAAKSGKKARARALLRTALEGSLPPKYEVLAHQLEGDLAER